MDSLAVWPLVAKSPFSRIKKMQASQRCRPLVTLGLTSAAFALLGLQASGQTVYFAEIDGSQSATGSAGTGSASIVIDTAANTLDYTITFSGLAGTETG